MPLTIFAVMRMLLLFLGYFSLILIPLNSQGFGWRFFPENLLLDGWVRGDSISCLTLARHGYWLDPSTGEGSPALLPVFPLLTSWASHVGLDAPIAALVIANVAFAAGLVMVYRLAAVRPAENTAERATLLLCVFPYGFVLPAAYPQSLALLFILLALYLAERGRLWPASTFSLLAALTHPL